jgi:hypothetical protein
MRPVKDSPDSIQRHAHPAPITLAEFGTQSAEERFNVAPAKIGRGWLGKDTG